MPIIKFAQFFVKTRHAHRHKSNFLVGPGRVQLATDHIIHEEGYTQEKEHSPPKKDRGLLNMGVTTSTCELVYA